MSPNIPGDFILFLPLVVVSEGASNRTVACVPVVGPPPTRPAEINPDINLAIRGFVPVAEAPALVDYGGETDGDAPQLAALFSPVRLPALVTTYRIFDWNWAGGPDGVRGDPITRPSVTLLGMQTSPGETIYLPARGAEIYGGGFTAMVLYADAGRITLKYTREDGPVWGYLLHVEGLAVDPAVVRRYAELNSAGRGELPALRNGESLGIARGQEIQVAVRDCGSFMDPRSRKDWWRGW